MSRPTKLIEKIQSVLSPNLLYPQWRKYAYVHPLSGHCYTASEALYYLWGKENGYGPHRTELETEIGVVSHWYLSDGEKVIDVTAAQFKGLAVPYCDGRRAGFLTKRPSKRAQEVMRRLEGIRE